MVLVAEGVGAGDDNTNALSLAEAESGVVDIKGDTPHLVGRRGRDAIGGPDDRLADRSDLFVQFKHRYNSLEPRLLPQSYKLCMVAWLGAGSSAARAAASPALRAIGAERAELGVCSRESAVQLFYIEPTDEDDEDGRRSDQEPKHAILRVLRSP